MKHIPATVTFMFFSAMFLQAWTLADRPAAMPGSETGTRVQLCGATADSMSKGALYYTLSKAEFGAMDSLCLQSEEPTLHISKYHILFMPKAGYMEMVSATGNAFGKVAKHWIAGAAAGDMFVFDYLKATDARGYEQRLQPITVIIR